MPVGQAWVGVSVKGENAVVLRSHEDDVMNSAGNAQSRHPQRLPVDSAIHRARKQFAERRGGHARGRQGVLLRVAAIAGQVVVIREHTWQRSDGDRGRGGSSWRSNSGRSNRVV